MEVGLGQGAREQQRAIARRHAVHAPRIDSTPRRRRCGGGGGGGGGGQSHGGLGCGLGGGRGGGRGGWGGGGRAKLLGVEEGEVLCYAVLIAAEARLGG